MTRIFRGIRHDVEASRFALICCNGHEISYSGYPQMVDGMWWKIHELENGFETKLQERDCLRGDLLAIAGMLEQYEQSGCNSLLQRHQIRTIVKACINLEDTFRSRS